MQKIRAFSLSKKIILTDCGLNVAFIRDLAEYPSELLAAPLSPKERAEGLKKSAPTAHRHWLLGRLAAKEALGKLWDIPAEEVEIIKGPSGRPIARSAQRPRAAGFVSISHTQGAAIAAAGSTPVGIDLERLDRQISPRVGKLAFDDLEMELATSAQGQQQIAMLSLWCAKEAAAKSWGRGLLNYLTQVRATWADWENGRITVSWRPSDEIKSQNSSSCPGFHGGQQVEVRLITYTDFLVALAEAI